MTEQYNSHSKTLNNICRKHPHIESCHSEYDGYGDDHNRDKPSYWIYCIEGYVHDGNECVSIHVKTVKEAIDEIKNIVEGVFEDGHSIPKRHSKYA